MEALVILGLLYFTPTLIALLRGHHNSAAIFVLNALVGWTVLGWIGAFVWSLTAVWRPIPAMPIGPRMPSPWEHLAAREHSVGAPTILAVAAITLLVLLLLT
jgi:T4 superinfection immunity protein